MLPGCIASSCGGFLFNFYPKLIQNAHLVTLPPVVVSYSILISYLMQNAPMAALNCLLLWWLFIQFLFKINSKCSVGCLASCGGFLFNSYSIIDAKCSPGCLASSCGRFSFNLYSNLIQNAHLTALPSVVVSYLFFSQYLVLNAPLAALPPHEVNYSISI